jgi:hypothetical protein
MRRGCGPGDAIAIVATDRYTSFARFAVFATLRETSRCTALIPVHPGIRASKDL